MLPELAHTRAARIVCLTGPDEDVRLRGWPCRAFIAAPAVQGPFRAMFQAFLRAVCRPVVGADDPEYVVLIGDGAWASLSAVGRERLVYHELSHLTPRTDPETGEPRLDDDGRPLLTLRPHDVETFHAEARRYGHDEATPALVAALAGHTTGRTGRRRPA